ncbi:hypothetical protein MMC13_005975 [Lambiella insularis]|nr:hypothetical protein [Lambiella insularis]
MSDTVQEPDGHNFTANKSPVQPSRSRTLARHNRPSLILVTPLNQTSSDSRSSNSTPVRASHGSSPQVDPSSASDGRASQAPIGSIRHTLDKARGLPVGSNRQTRPGDSADRPGQAVLVRTRGALTVSTGSTEREENTVSHPRSARAHASRGDVVSPSAILTSRAHASPSMQPSNAFQYPLALSRNISATTSAASARASSASSNTSSRPDPPAGSTTMPDSSVEEEILAQALEASRHAQAIHILQTADEGSREYLHALGELEGRAPALSLDQEGLEEHLRPPSYQVHRKDKTVNPLKWTTTSKGSDDPGDKRRITKEILEIMTGEVERSKASGGTETGELSKGQFGRIRNDPVPPRTASLPPTAKNEIAAAEAVKVAPSVAKTLDRTPVSMMGRRSEAASETAAQREAREKQDRSRRAERERLNAPFAAIAQETQRPS